MREGALVTDDGWYDLPRWVGNPVQIRVESTEQFVWFVRINNGTKDCFASIHSYPEPGVLLNKFVPMDLDCKEKPENALFDALKICEKLQALGVPHTTYFSGSKGFHVYAHFKSLLIEDDNHLKQAFASFQNMLLAECKLRTADTHLIGNTRAILRIPNTIHPKTGKYCVQVPWDMMQRADMNEILEWSSQPRPVVMPEGRETFAEHFKRIGYKREHIVRANDGEEQPTIEYHGGAVPDLVKALIPRPCIHQALLSHNPPHEVRREAASSIARLGFNYGYYHGFMHEVAELGAWVDRHNLDRFDYQLRHVFVKGYSRETSCAKLRSHGLCVGVSCPRFAKEWPEEAEALRDKSALSEGP